MIITQRPDIAASVGPAAEIVVYDKCCRIGGTLSLDDLARTSEVGDWTMPDLRLPAHTLGLRGGSSSGSMY